MSNEKSERKSLKTDFNILFLVILLIKLILQEKNKEKYTLH